jgi:hypothetical protein
LSELMTSRAVVRIVEAPAGDLRNLGVPAARLAAVAQGGVAVPEGFVLGQEALRAVLEGELGNLLGELGRAAAAAPEQEKARLHAEAVALLRDARLPWELEMELAKALDSMPEGVWLAPSQEGGGTPVFAPVRTKNSLVERVREIWGAVLDIDAPEGWHEPFSPVVALKAAELEASGIAELGKAVSGTLDVEAVFGLPQALADRKVARDRYRYSTSEFRQLRADVAKQRWQYTLAEKGVSRVEVAPALSGERKLAEESLSALGETVVRAAVVLDGAPAVVWGLADDVPQLLWVLDLAPYEARVKRAPEPKAAPERSGEALPVTATKLMVSAQVGEPLVLAEGLHGAFPLRIDDWLKANLSAHPLSEGGQMLDALRASLAEALLAAAKAAPNRQVVVSLSNLTSSDYKALPHGERFEPVEENPLMGFRGGARHLSLGYDKLLDAELSALSLARGRGARNLSLALPFVRTTEELRQLLSRAQRAGLERGHDFKVWMFVEVPSNVFLAEEFARLCDGLAVRLEPLYHLLSAVDPGSTYLADAGFGRPSDEGARRAVAEVIRRARAEGKPVALVGERLHESRELLETAILEGVDSVATEPRHALALARSVAAIEQRILLESAARLREGAQQPPDRARRSGGRGA